MTVRAVSLLCLLGLTARVSTSEMPLQNNIWQVDVEAGGRLFVGGADKAALKRAAELTIAQGYTHFVISNPNTQTSTTYAGSTAGFSQTNVNVIGNTAYGSTTYTPGVPIFRPQKNVTVTVTMFHAGEPGAANALDAAATLARLGS